MHIGALVAILALLLCAIVAHAEKPIVIKDSEAIRYVGKEVEVQGRVVSVTTSHWVRHLSVSEENTPDKRSLDSFRPGPE
jgi:hypothetical protein